MVGEKRHTLKHTDSVPDRHLPGSAGCALLRDGGRCAGRWLSDAAAGAKAPREAGMAWGV